MSLSLRMTISRESIAPALFIASYAIPPLIALSPITAMTSRRSPRRSRATAMPRADEIEVDAGAAPGQDFVGVGLMPDIPDQSVVRRVEDVMQRHGQLDDAEACAEMTAG